MTIANYSNLFDRLEPLVHQFNIIETRQIDTSATNNPLLYIRNDIETPFEAQSEMEQLIRINDEFDRLTTQYTSFKTALVRWAEAVLKDLGKELLLDSIIPRTIAYHLAQAMLADDQSVTSRDIIINSNDLDGSAGKIKAWTNNVGTGVLIYDLTREEQFEAVDIDSEICIYETMRVECIAAGTVGTEVFSISGSPKNNRVSPDGQGSGRGPGLTVPGNSISNGDFENWTGTTINAWSVRAGTSGTDFEKEVATANVLRGKTSIESNAGLATWVISQALPVSLQPWKLYLLGCWVHRVSGATGNINMGFWDTGLTTPAWIAAHKYTTTIASLGAGSFEPVFALVHTLGSVNNVDWQVALGVDTHATADVYIDSFQMMEMPRHNDIAFGMLAGATDFAVGDKFGYSASDVLGFKVENDGSGNNGLWQEFFSRMWNVQLPSSGSPTISEPAI